MTDGVFWVGWEGGEIVLWMGGGMKMGWERGEGGC